MLLSKYKSKNRYTTQDLAERFKVSHRTMHTWVNSKADISGREGSKVIKQERVLATEVKA